MHIGNIIKQTMEEQGRTTVWLAKQLSCNRSFIYRIYERPTIDTGVLKLISIALDRDFFEVLSKEVNS